MNRAAGGAEARRRVGEAARSPWVERLGRAGLIAKGVLYATMGVIALQVALGQRSDAEDQQGALRELATAPFGTVLLLILAIGLAGYAVWRLVQAALDEGDDEGAKGLLQRVSYAVRGVGYAVLAAFTFNILFGGGGGGGGQEEELTARVLALPFGRFLVGLAGLVGMGVGVYQAYFGIRREFAEDLETGRMTPPARDWLLRFGVIGYLARGVVFTLTGLLVLRAAITFDAEESGGLDQALAELARQPFGPWLLGLVSVGLLLFGAFCAVQARYGRIRQMD